MEKISGKNALKLKILEYAHKNGHIIKKEIAKFLNINLMTISEVVNELDSDEKLLIKACEGDSSGGRRPIVYKINNKIGYVIGVDIGGDNIRILLTGISGDVINKIKDKNNEKDSGELIINKILLFIEKLLKDSKITKNQIYGISIGVSGIIDSISGTSIYCPNIDGLKNFPIKKYIEEKTKFYVYVDDSVRCMAIAEKYYGIAKGYDNFLFVSLGKGIGAGIYVDNKIYRSSTGLSGELGHITVSEDGILCNCGNRGCLEAIASETGILRRAKEEISEGIISSVNSRIKNNPDNLTVEIIAEAAQDGDKFAFNLINRTGEYIGMAIATALNLFGVELVVLGGGISNAGDILIDAIRRTVKLRALNVISKKVNIIRTELDEFNTARGAISKLLNILFSDPIFNVLIKDSTSIF